MNTEQKVVSLELAKKLKAAGMVQETEEYWFPDYPCGYSLVSGIRAMDGGEHCDFAAPDCAELLEMLQTVKPHLYDHDRAGWYAGRYEIDVEAVYGSTPAEALGKLLL